MATNVQEWMQKAANESVVEMRLREVAHVECDRCPIVFHSAEAVGIIVQAIAAHAPGWISVEENGLPPVGRWVWVVCNGVVQRYAAFFTGLVWEWADRDADSAPQDEVSHWQLMPAPPRKKP